VTPSASAIFCWLQPFAFNAHARSRRSSRHSFARPGACPILQCTAQVGPALAFYAKINNGSLLAAEIEVERVSPADSIEERP
jgi:hypothetical protein